MNPSLQNLNGIDRVIHEPARLMVVSLLSAAEEADFTFLLLQTGLSKGNLSAHLTKLEEAGYTAITKEFRGKIPRTLVRLTDAGRAAFAEYRRSLKRFL
jgi:DNA-binding transcriptional ArsR family regulator